MSSLSYFPIIEDEGQLVDLLSRAAWHLSYCALDRIYVPIASEQLAKISWRVADGMDESIADKFETLRRKLEFVLVRQECDLEACMSQANIILRWKKDGCPGFVSGATLGRWLKGKKVLEVDPVAVRMEGSFYIEVGLHLSANKPALINENQAKFARLAKKLGKFERAYLMATGPSISHYKKYEFASSLNIVCNSVILDEELMQTVKPQILVFADPIFHFGPSQYAGAFRRSLVESAKRHDFVICMPFKYYSLFVSAVPELADRTIGIPFTKDREWNFALDKDFVLKTTANILTFLMIPLAGTFAKEIAFLGCDGRPLEENTYFWGHNEKTQINDKMANIREVHPGFFAIDYNDYYLIHCNTLGDQLKYGENQGFEFFSLAFSHIPALKSRIKRVWRTNANASDQKVKHALILDPDAIDYSGHFMAYNEKLATALKSSGYTVSVICNKSLSSKILDQQESYYPRLSVKSWTVGQADSDYGPRSFGNELLPVLDEIIKNEQFTLLYMYAGSVEHARILANATRKHPNLHVHINLFWLSFRNLKDDKWAAQWRELFYWIDFAGPRFIATVPTKLVQMEVAETFGVILDVAPHPSTAVFDDQLIRTNVSSALVKDRLSVLFPGSARIEKGYGATLACVDLLGKQPNIETVFRHDIVDSTPDLFKNPPKDLPANARVVEGPLSPEEFNKLFENADMVALPYNTNAFNKRTSGLLIDALCYGLPVVVGEGTWLAEFVNLYGFGIVVDATGEGLVEGVIAVARDYERYRQESIAARDRYLRHNSWRALVDFIEVAFANQAKYSRVLAIDLTPVGGSSATGRIKEAFFRNWPTSAFSLASLHPQKKQMYLTDVNGNTIYQPSSSEILINQIRQYDPKVIYYRAVDDDVVHSFAKRVIKEVDRPLVLHIMDDWPERMRHCDPDRYKRFDSELREMFNAARKCLSIGKAMATTFENRYGVSFAPFSNAIDPAAFPPRSRIYKDGNQFIIRYTGALAEDMTLESVKEFASAIESLPHELNIHFQIYTREPWLGVAKSIFREYKMVMVLKQVEADRYYQLIQDADALLIAYNFDERSRNYIGLSIANKMPECLAAGAPIIAYGPEGLATIDYLAEQRLAVVVSKRDVAFLAQQIKSLYCCRKMQLELGAHARTLAFEKHNVWRISDGFRRVIESSMMNLAELERDKPDPVALVGPFGRNGQAHWDETAGVAQLFKMVLDGHVMIDVGAHHGSALVPFLNSAWTIFAFEPDEKNRFKLLERLAKHKNKSLVSIDTRCVSNKSQKNVPFYQSEQSTGISGMSAFHESHVEAQRVDTTTLTEFFQDKELPVVDFLKIDTEGHDLFVLQGFPWERTKPVVIECEFEDSKTVPLGYTFHDLARFLVDKGYTVYVSEWHPIIRYGIRHDWNRLVRYPCPLADSKGWGNLLAFRDPIDEKDLVAAVQKVLKVGVSGGSPSGTGETAKPASVTVQESIQVEPIKVERSGFRVEPGRFFVQAAPNQWRYKHSDAPQRIWVATVNVCCQTKGAGFVGGLRLLADRAMTVNVSLGRHGKTQYEGTAKRLTLAPGAAETIKLSKVFTREHLALKLQVEVLELKSGDSALLTIDDLYLTESLASIRQRLGEADMTLREANRRFRDGDLRTAMGMYLLLGEQQPLKMYSDNALMAARKLGMAPVRSTEELLQWVRG
jgi:FkbM family methyltransferase